MKVDSYLIAKIVGVSQATVSRAFSRPEKVSPATRQKIMETAASLGYKLDKNASALRRKGTNTILLLYVKRDDGHYWTNIKRNFWIFSEAILSLTRYFETQPYIFEVKQVNSIFNIKESEIREHCDGVLIFDFVTAEESCYIDSWSLPYVICHRTIHLKDVNHSATDNQGGGTLQAEYLKEKGCKNPLYIMDDEDPFSHKLRMNGFLSVFPGAPVINSQSAEIMLDKLQELIEKQAVDGIAFVNDMLLVKTVTKMYRRNIFLQEKLSLIGYDNSTELLVLEKKPASMEIGISEIYRDAAEALLKLIRKETGSVCLIHKPKLVPGEND